MSEVPLHRSIQKIIKNCIKHDTFARSYTCSDYAVAGGGKFFGKSISRREIKIVYKYLLCIRFLSYFTCNRIGLRVKRCMKRCVMISNDGWPFSNVIWDGSFFFFKWQSYFLISKNNKLLMIGSFYSFAGHRFLYMPKALYENNSINMPCLLYVIIF